LRDHFPTLKNKLEPEFNMELIVKNLMEFHYDMKYKKQNVTKEFNVEKINDENYDEIAKKIIEYINLGFNLLHSNQQKINPERKF
jgi:hypothetical protein